MKITSTGGLIAAVFASVALLAGCASTSTGQGGSTTPGTQTATGTQASTQSSTPTGPATTATGQDSLTTTGSSTQTGTSGSTGQGDQSRCTTSELTITLGQAGGAAGSNYYPLIFTNTGSRECTLQGFPGVSYVTGDSGKQVGGAASRQGDKGPVVTLSPGASASAQLQEVNVQNFPADVCKPVSTRGLRVYPPGETHAAFVPQPNGLGCQADPLPDGQFQLSVRSIQPS